MFDLTCSLSLVIFTSHMFVPVVVLACADLHINTADFARLSCAWILANNTQYTYNIMD